MEDTKFEDLYYTQVKLVAQLTGTGYSPMEIAAILTRVALQIYRTTLSDTDYNQMIDFISESRNEVERFSLDVPLQ
jgi:hypothetical protein